jgi:hypothetical protein
MSFTARLSPQCEMGPEGHRVGTLPCRGSTNTEPGAVATGSAKCRVHRHCARAFSAIHDMEMFVYRKSHPVATAPGSVFVDPQRAQSKV